MSVTRAVIPAAGLGTRLRPLTVAVPKELLPVGRLPMMQYAVSECVAAGLNEIVVVVHEQRKRAILEFYNQVDWRALCGTSPAVESVNVHFVHQERPLGVMHAILLARARVEGEPFFLLMPDNVVFARQPVLPKLRRCFEESGGSVLGLIEVTPETAPFFGNAGRVEAQRLSGETYRVRSLQDKQPGTFEPGPGGRTLRAFGYSLLTPDFFSLADELGGDAQRGDEVPTLQALIRNEQVFGVRVEGALFDCGHWPGYWAANRFYWQQWNS